MSGSDKFQWFMNANLTKAVAENIKDSASNILQNLLCYHKEDVQQQTALTFSFFSILDTSYKQAFEIKVP